MTTSVSDDISGFFEKNYEWIYRYVRGMVRDANEAEDLTQEAFMRTPPPADGCSNDSSRHA